jgi:hypothetical protein
MDNTLETNPERPFPANADIENKGLLGREVAKKRLSGFVSRLFESVESVAFLFFSPIRSESGGKLLTPTSDYTLPP